MQAFLNLKNNYQHYLDFLMEFSWKKNFFGGFLISFLLKQKKLFKNQVNNLTILG